VIIMARPKRYNADYFSHDSGMRNDPKVKALRNKYGANGYAVWCMMLEILTASDFFTREIDDIEMEILSADFGIDANLFSEILSYMVRLRLLQAGDNGEYLSQKLIVRLQPVVDKRKNSKPKGVSVTESTQSKESKLNESKGSKDSLERIEKLKKSTWLDWDLFQEFLLIRKNKGCNESIMDKSVSLLLETLVKNKTIANEVLKKAIVSEAKTIDWAIKDLSTPVNPNVRRNA